MKRHTHLLTKFELAPKLGCTLQTINKWASLEGMPTAERGRGGRPSRYDLRACQRWLDARRRAAAAGAPVELLRERARGFRAGAVLLEQLYETRAKKLLDADDVGRVWHFERAAIRNIVTSAYTSKATVRRVLDASRRDGLAGVECALKDLAYEVLRELANPDRPIGRN